MAALDSLAELNNILEEWNGDASTEGLATHNPLPRLKRLADLLEHETEAFYKMDPDPFDDRHPGRSHPSCTLGHMFKALLKNNDFMNRFIFEGLVDIHGNIEYRAAAARLLYDLLPTIEKKNVFTTLVDGYILASERDIPTKTMACRLLYDVLPGLDTTMVFQGEDLVDNLLKSAEKAEEPLCYYATGLIGGAMDIQDVASIYKEKNSALVPKMMKRLHALQKQMHEEYLQNLANRTTAENQRHFSMFGSPNKYQSQQKPPFSPKGKYGLSPGRDERSNTSLSDVRDTNGSIGESPDKTDKMSKITSLRPTKVFSPEKVVLSPSGLKNISDNVEEPSNADKSASKSVFESLSKPAVNADSKTVIKDGHESEKENKTVKENSDVIEIVTDEGSRNSKSECKEKQTDSASILSMESQIPCCSKFEQDSVSNRKDSEKSLDGELDGEKRHEDITLEDRRARLKRTLSPSFYSEDVFRLNRQKTQRESFMVSDVSNSSWAEIEPYVIGSFCLDPLTLGMKQRLILQYLTPMAEYQELIGAAFEYKAMDLVFYYINLQYNRDVRLAFEALKYLAVLLCHKKFTIEFLQRGGVQTLLDVYRPSIAATGVSLCLYYLSYFEDAMERVCLLPDHVLDTLVSYVLWLLECSHDSSRCHAAMFFTQGFSYVIILNKFDSQDGLRRLYNVISTLEILNIESNETDLSEDKVFTMQQYARHVCVALKRYFETHLVLKVNELKRSHARNEGGFPQYETPAYKAVKLTPDLVQENIELLMELMPIRQQWLPETTFFKLGGITLLSQLIALSPDWNNYTGKPETIKSALDVIGVCCVTPKSQLALCESIPLPDDQSRPAINVFIALAEGEVFPDPEVQKAALSVIINCVCGPRERLGGGVGRYMGSGSRKKINWRLGEDILAKMWNGIRENNGIMSLLKLLSIKTPITDADSIRALACKALAGMARSETVRQIMGKLPLFSTGQLQVLMKEPVLQDKQQEHVKFCRYAAELIEKVSGRKGNPYSDASLEDIRRADIVAKSKIIFNEKELLQLIYDHLQSKGYHESADILHKEANLPNCSTPPPILPATPQVFAPVHLPSPSLFSPASSGTVLAPRPVNRQLSHPGPSSSLGSLPSHLQHTLNQPDPTAAQAVQQGTSSQSPQASGTNNAAVTGPIRFVIGRPNTTQHTPTSSSNPLRTFARSKYVKERDTSLQSPAMRKSFLRSHNTEYEISLDKIITEYLRKQHALCRNPVATCPLMSLFQPHRCPEPRGSSCAPYNFTARMLRKMERPRFGGMDGLKLDRKFIYSRFKAVKTYKDSEGDGFSCCTFTTRPEYLMMGTYSGSLKLIHTKTAEETGSFNCHSSPVTHCEHSRDGKLVLTSSSYAIMYSSALWSWGSETLDNMFNFEDHHIEFSRHAQDRLIGTKEEVGSLYDIVTGQRILKLYDAEKANNYRANRAILNPTDDLALNDGVLWDIRSGKAVHKFDKFNQYVSGTFHPVGLEIIINSEVWDIRTFRLLHTVPALDQCQINFSHLGNVMYATRIDEELDHESDRHNPYGSTFRTFDATNYAHIATMDVKSRSISDLCTDFTDTYLAVVENQQSADLGAEENICRLYEIGKLKDEDDQQNEDDEDAGQDDDDDDDDDDDEDDDIEDLLFGTEEDGSNLSNGGSENNDGESDQDANADGNAEGEDGDDNDDDTDDDDDDDDDEDDVIMSIGSDVDEEDLDDDDDDDFDLDGAFFALAD